MRFLRDELPSSVYLAKPGVGPDTIQEDVCLGHPRWYRTPRIWSLGMGLGAFVRIGRREAQNGVMEPPNALLT